MTTSLPFDDRIGRLDLQLFAAIHSQSSDEDKRSWLLLQGATRRSNHAYAYLEIGSHLGGSIQPYLVDPRCTRIFSIDKRPESQPDIQGVRFRYEGNSTARMLDNLRAISPGGLDKLVCFDASTDEMQVGSITPLPDLCFIDGEHTYEAVRRDFAFCASVCNRDGAIYFHDASIVFPALEDIVRNSRHVEGFRSFKLPGDTFVVTLGDDAAVLRDSAFLRIAEPGPRYFRRTRLGRVARRVVPGALHPFIRRVGDLLARPARPR